jgi:hypothetical protein
MLFKLAENTPKFAVFEKLNAELLHFLGQSVNATAFGRALFSAEAESGAEKTIGDACWDNDLTRTKFEELFAELQKAAPDVKRQLHEAMRDNQDLRSFFSTPNRALLTFLPEDCMKALKGLGEHLYSSTKELRPIITASGGSDINAYFGIFRDQELNGNICKACGMQELAAVRAGISAADQWRADYDHQLCKSKYPIYAVHPENLIPLCDVCNQDAKKAKDLFKRSDGTNRLAFYPYTEEARDFVDIEIGNLRDPEPTVTVAWTSGDATIREKLETWDEVYEIRRRVEGKFRSLEATIEDEIAPVNEAEFRRSVRQKACSVSAARLKRKEWAFWHQKLFAALNGIDLDPFIDKLQFVQSQGSSGADYILNRI